MRLQGLLAGEFQITGDDGQEIEGTPAPDNGLEALQSILDWANLIDLHGIADADTNAPDKKLETLI